MEPPTRRSGVGWIGAGVAAVLSGLVAPSAPAVDDGSQMSSRFRINYLGYFQHGDKLALFLSPSGGSKPWAVVDSSGKAVAAGVSRDHVRDDFASGDSFFGPIRTSLFRYADDCAKHMVVGYPGVTKDARSHRWDSGDRDDVDNNWCWGSNRLILDDGILLAIAAEEKRAAGENAAAARYARHALRVMDYLLGTKMMPTTGTGWAAREVDIDANAPLVWMAWWAQHRAAELLALDPAGKRPGERDVKGARS